ncbi:MAG: CoA transferase [Dehalococcoidia bacterium]|jgi:crotonobetainyl-CoA:carnitine CoA-transferase CaiB-like acyl-CoA transferase|nr:CoA transferase [Dehalococcoidia bacterium]MEE2928803.1 CoA transferase [Chloroflexota bacterium]
MTNNNNTNSADSNQPLKNYRVLDLSRIWAGPYCTKLMADMGAEIIKMESLSVYDSHRGPINPARGIAAYPDGEPGDEPWNRNGWFNCLHLSKYGITLELTSETGRNVFDQLVSISDVVIENFRQGSLERLGYSYETLRRLRPDLIYVSMPAFGNSGPWQKYLAYGIGQEQLSGMAHMTGYRGEGPMKSGINHGDPITGSHAAGVLLAALRYRKRTGKGMYIDVSQQESAVSLIGADVLAYQLTGEEPQRRGNRSPYFAPHNSYRCAGEDRWVAIAVTNDEEWRQLAQLVGGSELSADPRFATLAGRLENEDQLDDLISGWTVDKKAYDLCHLLQREGVPASPVMGGPDLLADPHYAARGTFVRVNHEQVGEKTYPGIPWKMSATPGKARWASPTLGQHNRQIYGELLAMPTDDITALEEQGIIGTIPTGSRII